MDLTDESTNGVHCGRSRLRLHGKHWGWADKCKVILLSSSRDRFINDQSKAEKLSEMIESVYLSFVNRPGEMD